MKHNIIKLEEFILDSLVDDYYNLWEPYSELKEYFLSSFTSEKEYKEFFLNKIIELQEESLIEFYNGTLFDGEEQIISPNFNKEELKGLLNDWKLIQKEETRLIISNIGRLKLEGVRKK